jgi:RNA polymerase sigma-70 factor (ECF subfamily)
MDDRRARFEAEMVPLLGAVHRLALRLTRRPVDAADLVQETMLRAYRGFDRFVPGTNRKAWLLRVTYSVFVNRYRQSRREPEPLPDDELERRFEQAVGGQEEIGALGHLDLGAWGTGAEVDAALRQLSEPVLAAVMLVDLEDLTYEEAAAALECPVGTVRSRLFRGRKQLFVALQSYARERGYLKGGTP